MIRHATEKDIPAIGRLMRSEPGFWKCDSRPDALRIALASAGTLAVVWDDGSEILGFACAHDCGFRAYLSELIVHKTARSCGIGKEIVRHIEGELRRRGCPVLFSDVWRTAEPFYRSLGWSEPDVTLLRKRLDAEAEET